MDRTIRAWGPVAALAAALVAAWPAPAAKANGNYTHVWVAADAVRYVPPGPLKDFLAREGIVNIVRNGAMYPDGGYAVSDGYGEISHWEPFHTKYLEWIRATYTFPWNDEAARHVAFLMGMTAHGMSDQLYDGMYLERHEYHDPDNGEAPFGLDGATDSCFAATQGPMELPDPWVPAEDLAPLYDGLGHHVEADVIALGSALVPVAIAHANDEASNPDTIAQLAAFYPWACQHQDDPLVPGSPVTHGPVIAAYWQVVWDRLQGRGGFEWPLPGTFFSNGSPWDYPADHDSPESWVSFAMPRGLARDTVSAKTVKVTRDDGQVHPTRLQVYYGDDSHLVNVKPNEDWTAGTTFTVTISPPIESWDGVTLESARTFTFSTLPAPAEPVPEAAEEAEPLPEEAGTPEPVPEGAEDGLAEEAGPDLQADVPAGDAADAVDSTGPAPYAAGDAATVGKGSGGCQAGSGGTFPLAAILPVLLALPFALAVLTMRRRGHVG